MANQWYNIKFEIDTHLNFSAFAHTDDGTRNDLVADVNYTLIANSRGIDIPTADSTTFFVTNIQDAAAVSAEVDIDDFKVLGASEPVTPPVVADDDEIHSGAKWALIKARRLRKKKGDIIIPKNVPFKPRGIK